MPDNKNDVRIKELTLLLLSITGWEEEYPEGLGGEELYRSWKGYLFEVLNEIEAAGLIHQFRNGKSVIILKKGLEKVKELKEKYFNEKGDE